MWLVTKYERVRTYEHGFFEIIFHISFIRGDIREFV